MRRKLIITWVAREVVESWPFFMATVLCMGFAFFWGSAALQNDRIWKCIVPSWASRSVSIILLNSNVGEEHITKVQKTVANSEWAEGCRLVRGEEAWSRIRSEFSELSKIIEELDPKYFPSYLEVVLSQQCLEKYSECEKFFHTISAMDPVEHVYSGLVWARKVFEWFRIAKIASIFSMIIFLFLGLVIALLMIKITCEVHKLELYLWDIMGASPWIIRSPFYLYSAIIVFFGAFTAYIGWWGMAFILRYQDGNPLFSECSLTSLIISGKFCILSAIFLTLSIIITEIAIRSHRKPGNELVNRW